jgi:hypothetical protein
VKKYFVILFLWFSHAAVAQNRLPVDTSERVLSKISAIALLSKMDTLTQSLFWPNVTPALFLKNLKKNIQKPLELSTGRGTNFCAYGAITYTCIKNEPLRYVECMLNLYKNGEAKYRNIKLNPSNSIKQGAGQIIYSGDLDYNVADQIWFLTLAHRFKGYLNWLDLKYKSGAENTRWAACNLAKFNRMLRRMCKYKVWSRGSDLIQLYIKDLPGYLQMKLSEGEVYLYWNNGILRKKNHNKLKRMIPTHFVVLHKIDYDAGKNNIIIKYWDGDYFTIKEIALSTFEKILYGISYTKYKDENKME